MKLIKNWNPRLYTFSAYSFSDKKSYTFDGNGFEIDGKDITCHLLRIHNCSDFRVKNLIFRNGNTESLKYINRKDIPFRADRSSIFEIIDGGAVLITGKSTVSFENCKFIANKSIMCGGAISNQSKGIVRFKNCTFEDNIAGHTGSAIDNLTNKSTIIATNCDFKNNISNTWLYSGFPHGHISIFPNTKAEIIDCEFNLGSIPFDYFDNSVINSINNKFYRYEKWDESMITKRRYSSLIDKFLIFTKMYWIIPKTIGRVFYKVN